MKKLLAVMLIFVMASFANAMSLQISVNGDEDPVETEYTLMPSETIELDIYSPDGYVSGDDTYFALVATVGGTVTGGVVLAAAPPDTGIYGQDVLTDVPGWLAAADGTGPWGSILNIGGAAVSPGRWLDQFIFHCDVDQGDVIISLFSDKDMGTAVHPTILEDRIIIHQIPEPATMALLSLGGLFLLRRRK